MKYFVKFWKPEAFPPKWETSYCWANDCGYDDLNVAHAVSNAAKMREPANIYIVVDDKEAQPPPP